MMSRLSKEDLARKIESLPDAELAIIDQLVQLLAERAQSVPAQRPAIKLGGRWKGRVPADFDVEKAIKDLRQAHEQRLDELGAP